MTIATFPVASTLDTLRRRWPTRLDAGVVAVVWGVVLPIEFITKVPHWLLDGSRYLLALALIVAVPPTLEGRARARVDAIAILLLVLAAARLPAALVHDDSNGLNVVAVLVASVLACTPIAWRPNLHRSVLYGFMIGAMVSGVVSLMQALGIPTLRPPGPGAARYPGLSTYTMLLTWQLLFAVFVATHLLATERPRSLRWWTSIPALLVCSLASLTNGAQGGLLGLVFASVAFVGWRPRLLKRFLVSRSAVVIGLGVAAAVGAAALAGIRLVSIVEPLSKGGLVNERARWDIAVTGWNVLLDNPVLGVGRQQFIAEHVIAPHFLPIESGSSAGVAALVVAAVLVALTWWIATRRPARGPYPMLGAVLLAAMCANTLTEAAGPFIGVSHLIVLLVAVVAAAGGAGAGGAGEGGAWPGGPRSAEESPSDHSFASPSVDG